MLLKVSINDLMSQSTVTTMPVGVLIYNISYSQRLYTFTEDIRIFKPFKHVLYVDHPVRVEFNGTESFRNCSVNAIQKIKTCKLLERVYHTVVIGVRCVSVLATFSGTFI